MASGADRISALPDGVREHILSFLPAHEAVRTTVLARSWRDLWMRSPAFHITGWGTVAKFSKFVFRLLRLRRGIPDSGRRLAGDPGVASAPLHSCHFDLTAWDFDDEHAVIGAAMVNGWIQYALCCQVQVLRFCFDSDVEPKGRLKLHYWTLVSAYLTKLQLSGIAVNDSLDFSGCPALLDLELDNAFLNPGKISSPSLQYLSIARCEFGLMGYKFGLMDRTRIRAPSLVSLKLIECSGRTPLLERIPSLASAIVELDYTSYDKCSTSITYGCDSDNCDGCQDYYGPHNDHTSCLLLNGLWEATNLELSVHPDVVQKDPVRREERCIPLEESVISDHLKTIEIKCHEVDAMVVKILKILAASGLPLEQINIQSSALGPDCEFLLTQ
ncbi:hypothetical protein EJB05_29015 [Eragrostis curvula]|uniref:F-box domain-containing protein n=1 Tax=Eragrostis curvula TaxID=38414 RepID=A0A5J9SEL9_9POAL|nr:hypothetical protein EJB05_56988 [Eragrostis curvula]TVU26467.1 hypothetical protein EJB05_29015 [Eragrostis curvula]